LLSAISLYALVASIGFHRAAWFTLPELNRLSHQCVDEVMTLTVTWGGRENVVRLRLRMTQAKVSSTPQPVTLRGAWAGSINGGEGAALISRRGHENA
jgi:hypothetical protein